jgi:hypothetical protein
VTVARVLFAVLMLAGLAGCRKQVRVVDAGPPVDPCAAFQCEMGTHCELRPSDCGATSCPSVPECVPDPDENPCNVTACPGEQVCVVEQGKAVCLEGSDESEEIDAGEGAPGTKR